MCSAVRGWCHIAVFIAGATMMPFLLSYGRGTPGRAGSNKPVASHALTTDMTRLSDKPCAIFARQLADSGAITIRSAHRLSSMCKILSPLIQGFLHSDGCSPDCPCRKLREDSVRMMMMDTLSYLAKVPTILVMLAVIYMISSAEWSRQVPLRRRRNCCKWRVILFSKSLNQPWIMLLQ
ncbi:hypothetical protein KC326_g124 [Hortaea werneckii]|nr:hypothetical protein KC326_g124 [Hortaea werneckii]